MVVVLAQQCGPAERPDPNPATTRVESDSLGQAAVPATALWAHKSSVRSNISVSVTT
jgi:hypothetical protein